MKGKFLTYEDWELIHAERQKARRHKRALILKQKLFGLLFVTIGIACPILLDGDITASALCLPIGLYLIGCQSVIR